MAALYAQGLPWDEAHRKVRMYASRMSSVHHLLQVHNTFPACIHDTTIRPVSARTITMPWGTEYM
jgi:hypothetical protein